MKSKRLTIIFFSVMMLAATPRAMSHFNNYSDALQQKVEAEWLDFLLGFTAPVEIERIEATPQYSQHPSICTKGTTKDIEPAKFKWHTDATATPGSLDSKKQSFEYKFTNVLSASSNTSRVLAPGALRFDLKAPMPTVHALSPPAEVVAENGDERKKAEHVWRLTQSTLNGRNKAARALIREFKVMIAKKSRSAEASPFDIEKVIDQLSELDEGSANQGSDNGRASSEESMR